tara:strand:+ start:944 stop:1606 length:663 start_codon:yes stop_codon:yes gene_type:complete
MKFYTFYTPSHKCLYEDFFLPNFPHNEFSLIAEEFDQECPSGAYCEDGWNNTMRRKLAVIINGLKENQGGMIVHGDCDIQFFPKNGSIQSTLIKELGDKDMAFQSDGTRLCAGFFITRCTDKVVSLFEEIEERLEEFLEDQDAMNKLLPASGISYKSLSSKFYTVAMDNQWRIYNGEEYFNIEVNRKATMLVHHANYTVGLENKINLLKSVKHFIFNLLT